MHTYLTIYGLTGFELVLFTLTFYNRIKALRAGHWVEQKRTDFSGELDKDHSEDSNQNAGEAVTEVRERRKQRHQRADSLTLQRSSLKWKGIFIPGRPVLANDKSLPYPLGKKFLH